MARYVSCDMHDKLFIMAATIKTRVFFERDPMLEVEEMMEWLQTDQTMPVRLCQLNIAVSQELYFYWKGLKFQITEGRLQVILNDMIIPLDFEEPIAEVINILNYKNFDDLRALSISDSEGHEISYDRVREIMAFGELRIGMCKECLLDGDCIRWR
jgi:hypothetical protein